MKTHFASILAGALLALSTAGASADEIIWATDLGPLGMNRGNSTIGDFPDWYGGTFPGTFPISLTNTQARAAILGAPDNTFVSLPGNEAASPTPSGTGFRWAFADVMFSTHFGADSDLVIRELGNNAESVYLFIWAADGSNVQLTRTRGADDTMMIDLAPYAAFVGAHGGYFTHVTLGGLDLLGASKGFDLDAVGITRVPEPASLALLALGLCALVGLRRASTIRA